MSTTSTSVSPDQTAVGKVLNGSTASHPSVTT